MSVDKSNKGCGIIAIIIFIACLIIWIGMMQSGKLDGIDGIFQFVIVGFIVFVGVCYFIIKIKDGEL
jgi:hypothetical protein